MAAPSKQEVARALKVAWRIPGLYRRDEAAFLYRLARRKGTLVEIGCWMGRTTSLLVQAASVWGARVVTVDPFAPMPAPHPRASPERWRANLRGAGLTPPELIQRRSDQAGEDFAAPIALLFIDGDHAREAVLTDLELWAPKVQIGGVVALHDMFYPTIAGVAAAVAEWWAPRRHMWEFIGLRDFTVAFRRMDG